MPDPDPLAASTRTHLAALLAVLALGLACLAACSTDTSHDASAGSSSTSADGSRPTASATPSASAAAAPPRAPRRTACYALTYDQALAPTDDQATTGCGSDHTSQTFLVKRLRTVVGGHLLAIDSDTVQHEVAQTCPQRLATYLDGTPEQLRLSLLRAVWFTPTVAQSDAGASWFRCDVVAAFGDESLAELAPHLKGALAKARTAQAYAMCATDRPGAADFRRVLCRDPHTWRAVRSVDLSGLAGASGTFPGLDRVEHGDDVGGSHVCADAARALAPDALDYQWGYEWPTREQWRTGQTYGRCWAPDTGTG